MPVVNPGIRRYIGSAIQRLFNSASFSAPLTHSLTLERGTGSPTFTRATTATFQDFEGVLRTVPSGCARFQGGRMVRNWIQAPTESWSNAGWEKVNISVVGTTLTATAANAVIYDTLALGMGTNKTAIASVVLTRVVGTGDIDISLNGGTTYTTVSVDGTRKSVVLTSNINGQFAIRIATSGDSIIAEFPQLEDITGRTDQTTPSEYVSVGVLSAPYHGAGVDGVEFFDTDLSGNPIAASTLKGYLAEPAATNLCTKSQEFDAWTKGNGGAGSLPVVTANDGVAPDGTTTADKVVFVAPVSGDISTLSAAPATGAGTYTGSIYIKAFAVGDIGKIIGVRGVASATYLLVTLTADWQRVSRAEVRAASNFEITLRPSEGTSSGTVSVYLWGAQVELGSAATSYIPTTTLAVARNADVESVPTSGNIIAASGWISLTYTPTHAPSGTVFLWGTYVDASNYTAILHDATNLIFRKRIAGTNYDATIANAFVSGTTYKMAATWGASGTGIALNGTLGTGHANTTAAQIGTAMQTGADGNGANQPGMSLGNERIGQRQLSSSELQAITR